MSLQASAAAPTQVAGDATSDAADLGPIVQYLVIRKDLKEGMGWPLVRLLPLLVAQHALPPVPHDTHVHDHGGISLMCLQGSIVAQACHAAVAAVWENKDDPTTTKYCSPEQIDSMHKVGDRTRSKPLLAESRAKPARVLLSPSAVRSNGSCLATFRIPPPSPLHPARPSAPLSCLLLAPQVVLEIKGETQLRSLAEKLTEGGVAFKLWTEQPENFVTCLATKPYHKQEVAQFFKKLNLAK